MKRAAIIFLPVLLIISCEKDSNTCNCNNPIEDLPWLQELKGSLTNCTCRMSIFQAEYNSQTVFYSLMNDELCNSVFQVELRDCSGNSVKTYDYLMVDAFNNEVRDRRVIYSCKTGNNN